jgi:NAD(P)-dependent dehydrogenase (short-subunit alcohol dehydrogenase family)
MKIARHGLVINVASTAAFQPTPTMAVYGATKAFVLSFTEALWQESKGTGVACWRCARGHRDRILRAHRRGIHDPRPPDAAAGRRHGSEGPRQVNSHRHFRPREHGDGGVHSIPAATVLVPMSQRMVQAT